MLFIFIHPVSISSVMYIYFWKTNAEKFCSFVIETTANYRNIKPNVRNHFASVLQGYLFLTFEIETGCLNTNDITTANTSIVLCGLFH